MNPRGIKKSYVLHGVSKLAISIANRLAPYSVVPFIMHLIVWHSPMFNSSPVSMDLNLSSSKLESRLSQSEFVGAFESGFRSDAPFSFSLQGAFSAGSTALLNDSISSFAASLDHRGELDPGFWNERSLLSTFRGTGQPETARELVIVDRGVENWQALLSDIRQQQLDGRSIDVVTLDDSRDGIQQITEALAGFQNLTALHVISHGAEGGLRLGNGMLTNRNLPAYAGELTGWRDALSGQADIMLYGCNLAAGLDGQSLVDGIAALTGADVAASSDVTGAATLGGNWGLEYQIGKITSDIALSALGQLDWQSILDRSDYNLTYNGTILTVDATANDNAFFWTAASPLYFTIDGFDFSVLAETTEIRFRGGLGNDSARLIGSELADAMVLFKGRVSLTTPTMIVNTLDIESFDLDGRTGYDNAILYGTDGDDQFDLSASLANVFTSTWNLVTTGFDRVVAHNSAGIDTVNFFDSAGDEVFNSYNTFSYMSTSGSYLHANGFEVTIGHANAGGFDRARISDSASDDILTSTPVVARISNSTTVREARGFDLTYAESSAGGNDSAILLGDSGADTISGSVNLLTYYGAGYLHQIAGFKSVTVDGGLGTNRLFLTDSAGADYFRMSYLNFYWDESGRSITANGFIRQVITSTGGGYDTVQFHDSAGNDLFTSYSNLSLMTSGGDYLQAGDFEEVSAWSTSGNDSAAFVGSIADETVRLYSDVARYFGTTTVHHAYGFTSTSTNLSSGGADWVELHGTTGADTLNGNLSWLRLAGTGYSNYVTGYTTARVYGSSGYDNLYLTDSALDDYAELRTGDALLGNAVGWVNALEFEGMYVTSGAGGTDSVTFYDSALDDMLYSESGFTTLSNSQTTSRANGFHTILAHAGNTGLDTLTIRGTAGQDTITLNQNYGQYDGGGVNRHFADFNTAVIYLDQSFDIFLDSGATYQYFLIDERPLARNPILPQAFVDTTFVAPTGGQIWTVNAGGNLQTVINSAGPGDTIVLEAGATFTGNFILPDKTLTPEGGDWIYIVSSELDQLPEGERVGPDDAQHMARIVSPNSDPALMTDFGSDHYRLAGIEISTDVRSFNLVLLGSGFANPGDPIWSRTRATTEAQLPDHITFDRTYINSTSTTNASRVGIGADGKNIGIVDSYFSNFKDTADAQAIHVRYGLGPYKIVNNFLESTGENILFGGEHVLIPNAVPSDIEIRGNHFFKRLEWKNPDLWGVKNLLELKLAQRVHISGNVFQNCWPDAQNGYGIVFTARNQYGDAPWSVVKDITFENNIVKDVAVGFLIRGDDSNGPSQPTERILIANNLVYNVESRLFTTNTFSQPIYDLTFRNNTLLHSPGQIGYSAGTFQYSGINVDRFVFENNILTHGISGLGFASKTTNRSVRKNGFIFSSDPQDDWYYNNFATLYPENLKVDTINNVGFVDYANGDFHLTTSSPFKNAGTDGKDLGVDVDELLAATKGVVDQ